MNVLLLGNGFDINCGLPTKYINFLQIVDFLDRHQNEDYESVGQLSKAMIDETKSTQNGNESSIAFFYNEQNQELSEIYDTTPITQDDILKIINPDGKKFVHDNIWFRYFSKQCAKDIGWVDFEKEMEQILVDLHKYRKETTSTKIEDYHKYCDPDYSEYNLAQTPECQRIVTGLKLFDIPLWCCHYDIVNGIQTLTTSGFESKNMEYLKNGLIQWEKIYDTLESERLEFVNIFKMYLTHLVEKISDNPKFQDYAEKQSDFLMNFFPSDIVISFNYTNTFKKLPFKLFNSKHNQTKSQQKLVDCLQIHGALKDEHLVLGIKPNDDGIKPLSFQKDVQRFRYGSNSRCIAWLRDNEHSSIGYLTVMGCSLDITDGDIIRHLFEKSKKIKLVYYNNDDAKYCKNIKTILGTKGLEGLQERFQFKSIQDCKIEYTEQITKTNTPYFKYTPNIANGTYTIVQNNFYYTKTWHTNI